MPKILPSLVAMAPLVVAASACDTTSAFTTKFASDFVASGHTVSVLGVYKDGRMSDGGWEILKSHVLPALGGRSCAVGYDILAPTNSPLADAIDDYTLADGPTDELLAQLAPAARGDSILVLTLAGRVPMPRKVDVTKTPAQDPSGKGGGMSGRWASVSPTSSPEDANALDISASLYSVHAARSVALLSLQYRGQSVEEAMSRFGSRLADAFPRAVCADWSRDVAIDPERIRKIAAE